MNAALRSIEEGVEEPLAWVEVGSLDDWIPGTGAAVLIEGQQIAVVRTRDGEGVYAVSNYDPFSKAYVLCRGIVGDKAGAPKIASPIYKQSFDLRTGQCLDDPQVRVPVFPTRVLNGRIWVGLFVEPAN